MQFDVHGPFVLKRYGPKKLITLNSAEDLWKQLASHAVLGAACGCYVFAIKAGRGYTPHYVGKACRQIVIKEALNDRNRERYNDALNGKKGTPVIFFLPMLTKGGRYRRPKKADGSLRSIDFLERWLISQAIYKNPKLINRQETMFLRNLHVVGIFNAKKGESTKHSGALKKALW